MLRVSKTCFEGHGQRWQHYSQTNIIMILHWHHYECGTPSGTNPRTHTSYHGFRQASAEHSPSCPCRAWTMEATICQISTTPLSTMSQIALSAPILSCKAQQNAKTCATRKRDRETSLATLRTCATTGGSSWHPARPIARTPPAWIAWMTGFTPFTDRPQLDRSRSIGFFKAGRASQSKIRPEGSLSYSDPP